MVYYRIFFIIRRYRILNGLYRGRISESPEYLAGAIKIIIHTNYMYTRNHQQRIHEPFVLPLPSRNICLNDIIINTGVTYNDIKLGMKVKVWWLDEWWSGQVTYKSDYKNCISVRFIGDRNITSGILPRMTAIE